MIHGYNNNGSNNKSVTLYITHTKFYLLHFCLLSAVDEISLHPNIS